MSVISITLTESELEIIPGIPKFILLESNIPSNIYYTLDGTDPNNSSNLVLGNIFLPTTFNLVTLKYFASNGIDTTSVTTILFEPDKAVSEKTDAKVPDAPLTSDPDKFNLYPFGSANIPAPGKFDDTALEIVDDPNIPGVSNGFDGDGNPAVFTDKTLDKYPLIFPPGDGERPNKIGSLVDQTTILYDTSDISEFKATSINKLFNPRALVMYQDSSDPNVDPEISAINKQFFFSQNLNSAEGPGLLFTNAYNNTAPGGGFVNYKFNKRTQKLTFYYYDNYAARWIISTEDYKESQFNPKSLSKNIFVPGVPGSRFVYRWIPFVPYHTY